MNLKVNNTSFKAALLNVSGGNYTTQTNPSQLHSQTSKVNQDTPIYVPQNQESVSKVEQPPSHIKDGSTSNILNYISIGLAVVASGLGCYAITRNSNGIKSLIKQVEQHSSDTTSKLDSKFNEIQKDFQDAISSIHREIDTQIAQEVENRNSMARKITEALSKVKGVADSAFRSVQAKTFGIMHKVEFIVGETNINGKKLNLVQNLHGYGANEAKLTEALRSESAKRMLGIGIDKNIEPPEIVTVRVPTSEFKGIASTGGMSIVPREVLANIGALINNKQKTHLVVDVPMYLGEVERNIESGKQSFNVLKKLSSGKFQYLSNNNLVTGKELEHIGTLKVPIYTANTATKENVEMYISKNMEQVVDYRLMKQYLKPEDLSAIEEKLASGESYDSGILHVGIENIIDKEKNVIGNEIRAKIKFDTVFYKNDKFKMSGPSGVNGENNKNIYNNYTHNAGETERFIYFDKFFYESLLHANEVSSENIGADIIIGNDWQTGGISAMMKLLTHAKQAVGEITEKQAKKLLNTPVFTILHNANESGTNYYATEKLLNVMFGEHARKIVENAHMPNVEAFGIPNEYALPAKCWNGLLHKDCINPQTMAAAYSDVLIPVSEEYGKEITSNGVFGRSNFELFRLRQYATDHPEEFGLKSIIGITNGCDKVNNILTENKINDISKALNINRENLRIYKENDNVLEWHNFNKKAILEKVRTDIADKVNNPMKVALNEMTDLSGVDVNTMVISTAGRIVDQKGLDILANSIYEFYRMNKGRFSDGNYPVFYVQGIGANEFIEPLLKIKQNIANTPELGGRAAANRIVFANLFAEPGRYDACQLMSDFTAMPSWFEPCGLFHKEVSAKSGAIPIVNMVGGLVAGLRNKVNAIFAKFVPPNPDRAKVIEKNSRNFAQALTEAYDVFNNKIAFGEMIEKSYKADHSWLTKGGPAEKYVKLMIDYKVIKPEILENAA